MAVPQKPTRPPVPPVSGPHLEHTRKVEQTLDLLYGVAVGHEQRIEEAALAGGLTWGDPRVWDAAATYPPLRQVEGSDGAWYVSTSTTTGDDPTAGGPWEPVPTALDASLRAGVDPAAGQVGQVLAYRNGKFRPQPKPVVDVRDFGTVGDGVADDTAALQAAADAAAVNDANFSTSYGHAVLSIPPGTYRTTSTVTISGSVDASPEARILADHAGVALLVRRGTGNVILNRHMLHLPVVEKATVDWQSPLRPSGEDTSVGIRLVNVTSSTLRIPWVRSFHTGVECLGDAQGFAYNEVTFGHLDNNKRNLRLSNLSTNGWCNENNFYGGRFSQNSPEGTNIPGCRHILVEQFPAGFHLNNNNWWSPSVEGNGPEIHVELHGWYSNLMFARWEAQPPKLHLPTGGDGSRHNVLFYGWGSQLVVVTGDTTNFSRFTSLRETRFGSAGAADPGVLTLYNSSTNTGPTLTLMSTNSAGDPVTEYAARFTAAAGLEGKRTTDAFPRLRFDSHNGRLTFGLGTAAPFCYFSTAGSLLTLTGATLAFLEDNQRDLGTPAYRPRDIYAGSAFVISDGGALPSATVGRRGRIVMVHGAAGVADRLYICRKNAADAYEWAQIA
jgi:hypothetical protein